jgi:hypothetical protein
MSLVLSGTVGVSDVDGSAATPAIRGTDTNTGIFFPAADTIAFAEGGAEVARFDSAGNLGIGTTTPGFRLDVNGVGNFQGVRVGTNGDTINGSSGLLAFQTSGTERMRLDASGNLGVGTTSPTARLHVLTGSTYAANFYTSVATLATTRIAIGGFINGASGGGGSAAIGAEHNHGATAQSSLTFYTHDGTNQLERARITSGGNFLLANNTQFYGMNEYTNKRFMNFSYPSTGGQFGFNNDCTEFGTPGNGSGLVQMRITQGGNVGCRGAFSGGQTLNDYAEYFEWSDGNLSNEDRIGVTVVLDEGKVRPSTDTDSAQAIIGVVSGTAGVVLGSSPFEWAGKYEKDEFGRIKTYQETWIHWTDEAGPHNYKEGEVPEGVVVPEYAERRVYTKEVVSSSYNESATYTSREHRPEWACIGLTGQVHVKRGQVVGDRWIKMKSVSENVDLWFIR